MKYIIFILLFVCNLLAYNHDLWNTEPKIGMKEYEAFTTSYFTTYSQMYYKTTNYWMVPLWVSYQIKGTTNKIPNYPRPANWTTDEQMFRMKMAPIDDAYKNSGYDRGHLCMKEIASRISSNADRETHTMLNAVPQLHKMNAGVWLDLEKRTMDWADTYGDVWVICGPVFSNMKPTKYIGTDKTGKIAVPDWCYKIVIKTNPGLEALPFLISATYTNNGPYDLSKFKVSIAKIEQMTGLTFLANTSINKTNTQTNIWKWNKKEQHEKDYQEEAR